MIIIIIIVNYIYSFQAALRSPRQDNGVWQEGLPFQAGEAHLALPLPGGAGSECAPIPPAPLPHSFRTPRTVSNSCFLDINIGLEYINPLSQVGLWCCPSPTQMSRWTRRGNPSTGRRIPSGNYHHDNGDDLQAFIIIVLIQGPNGSQFFGPGGGAPMVSL